MSGIDLSEFNKELRELHNNPYSNESLSVGDHDVKLDKIKVTKTKTGDTLVIVTFKGLNNEDAGVKEPAFYNIEWGFQYKNLISLIKEMGYPIDYNNLPIDEIEISKFLNDVYNNVEKYTFKLSITRNYRNFKHYKIIEVIK